MGRRLRVGRSGRTTLASLVVVVGLTVVGCGSDKPATSESVADADSAEAGSAETVAASEPVVETGASQAQPAAVAETIASTAATETETTPVPAAVPIDISEGACFGLTIDSVLDTIGNGVTADYDGPIGPPTDSSNSSACAAYLEIPAGPLATIPLYVTTYIEVFDPMRHTMLSEPTTYAALKANNVECCNVAEVAGLGDEAFSWTVADELDERGTAILFRQGEITGAVAIRVSNGTGEEYTGWDPVLDEMQRWTTTLVATMEAAGLTRDDLPPQAAPQAPMTTAPPLPTTTSTG